MINLACYSDFYFLYGCVVFPYFNPRSLEQQCEFTEPASDEDRVSPSWIDCWDLEDGGEEPFMEALGLRAEFSLLRGNDAPEAKSGNAFPRSFRLVIAETTKTGHNDQLFCFFYFICILSPSFDKLS